MKIRLIALMAGGMLAVCSCASPNEQLVFVSSNTLGVTVVGSVADNGAEFTVGYRSNDMAIMPAYAREGARQSDTRQSDIRQITSNGNGGENASTDSLSVLARFETDTNGGRSRQSTPPTSPNPPSPSPLNTSLGLSKFFATGAAAQNLSSGFACELILNALPVGSSLQGFDPAHCLNAEAVVMARQSSGQ